MVTGNNTKHLIIGTAGHVDHGKTTLIQAMTGINPDRLKEEQERGLTIDLGFAFLKLPSGRNIGIVDVPGHERFLKNMLAGASGVDIALLVVAADEGVMPQTREHLEILELLESKYGIIALSKCDMVDEEWLEVVEDDLRNYLKNTFLGNARIIRVSGVTGQGIDELIKEIDRLADAAEQKPVDVPFRLPIDRIFSITGFGTVVTGTLVSGTIKVGDPAKILPGGINTRIRQIEVHSEKVNIVQAGTRVALNLAGVDVNEINRGNVLVSPGYLQATRMLDVSVRVIEDAPRALTNRARIRLHIGTAEIIGRAMVLGCDQIEPGKKGFVQLRLEKPVVAGRGDRFVLRFYSPMRVLGGGVVLDPTAVKHKTGDKSVIERLERKLKGDPVDIVEDALSLKEIGFTKPELIENTGLAANDMEAAVEELIGKDRVIQIGGRLIHKGALEGVKSRIKAVIGSYHEHYPLRSGMPKEELRRQIGIEAKSFQTITSLMASEGEVSLSEAVIKLPGYSPALSKNEEKLARSIEDDYRRNGMNPSLLRELEQKYGAEAREIILLLVEQGELVRVDADLYFHKEAIERAESALREYLKIHGQITIAQFRDLIGSSRKYVVPLSVFFDDRKVTRRVGDQRVLFK